MKNESLFSESQRFKQWWLWLILLGVNILFMYGIYQQVILGKPFGDNPGSNGMLISTFLITVFTTVFIGVIRLDTEIKSEGVYVRFFPVQIKFRFFPWNSITKSYIRYYNAIAEYGGWGFRIGIFGRGRAFNISGNMGLQLEFDNNKKLLIGTRNAEELQKVLISLNQNKT